MGKQVLTLEEIRMRKVDLNIDLYLNKLIIKKLKNQQSTNGKWKQQKNT